MPHDFLFRDRLGASGIRFRHVPSLDLTKFYRASHYDHDAATGGWRSTRGGPPLADLLAAELAQLTGAEIAFD